MKIMFMGSRQCGSPGNLANSLSRCLMFFFEVGRAVQGSLQQKQCSLYACVCVRWRSVSLLKAGKRFFQGMPVNNTPIADVLRFVSKTLGRLLVT